MNESCVAHPLNQPILLIRAWQVRACGGDHCAAALLSIFETHHRYPGHIQQHTISQLSKEMLGLYGKMSITRAIKTLEKLRFVIPVENPHSRARLDRTRCFIFDSDAVNRWIQGGER